MFRVSLLAIFLSLVLPITNTLLQHMVRHAMKKAAELVVVHLQQKSDPESMVKYLVDHELNIFFYTTLVNDQLEIIHDSRKDDQHHPLDPQEKLNVIEAFKTGKAFDLGNSSNFWTYAALRFDVMDKQYVLLTSLTTAQVGIWVYQFRVVLFVVFTSFICLYSVILWWGGSRLIRPLLDITRAIRPYALSKTDVLSPIPMQRGMVEECKHLAVTINSLLEKVKENSRSFVEERNEKEAILESLMEGIMTIDAAGFVRYANQTASHMLGIPRRQLIGKPFMPHDSHPKIDLFKSCQAIIRLAGEQGTAVTDSVAMGDGHKVYLDLIAVPKPFRTGTIIILQDKSSQFRVVEMGKDFIANASHELRTPITIIKGFAETLQDLPVISPPMLSEITEKIVRNCHRMDTLVKNLLTLADIEYVPESRFQPCDIVALADNCRHLLLTLSPTTRVDIEKSHDRIMADADPDLLELALMNLLENGIKYSKPPAHLTIYIKEQGDEVLIAIQDRGIGIPPADQPHIFERFYTVDKAHSRRLGGAGLGLSIVKTIIEKHEGTISVASVVGQGTTFTIQLPQHRHALHPSVK
ncbi:MAG: PAS domain-containing protein [Verrucomicrobia bacterium]|nr:PAS domain-containing protein [Verrucomicrobiota bacterium]